LRILWLTTDRSQRVAQLFDPLRRSVEKIAGVDTVFGGIWTRDDVRRGRTVAPKLDPGQVNAEYDIAFTDAPFAFLGEDWERITIPKCALIEDLHGQEVPKYVGACYERGFDTFFVRYWTAAYRHYPHLWECDVRHLPHCVDTDIFHPYDAPKEGALFTGSMTGDAYPVRQIIVSRCAGKPWFRRIPRPVERDPGDREFTGAAYARALSGAAAAFATPSIYGYTVAKYFEIPACGTTLLCRPSPDMEALGFCSGTHYLELDLNDIPGRVEWALEHPEMLGAIAAAGRHLIGNRHTTTIRARELVDHFADIAGTRPDRPREAAELQLLGNA